MIFTLVVFGLTAFFLLGIGGEWFGLAFAVIAIFLATTLGDKLFLVLVSAKEVEDRNTEIYRSLENLSCLNQLQGVRIYRSFKIPVNVLCIQPLFGSPSIIYSNVFIDTKDMDLIRKSMKVSLPLLKRKVLKLPTLVSFIVSFLMVPRYFLKKYNFDKLSILYSYFLAPIIFLKNYVVFGSWKKMSKNEKGNIKEMKFFLRRYPAPKSSFTNDLSQDFSIIKKPENGLWDKLIHQSKIPQQKIISHEREN